jgi:uncharacterized protein YfaA (DUF2138 family)
MKNKFRFLLFGTLAWATTLSLFPFLAQASQALPDSAPDVVINTKSLSKLPRDIVKVPVLRDLLTEDFVTYYQHGGADWLSLRGALVRLAYENASDLPTDLLSWILNSPAEVALWKSPSGKLNRFLLVMDQTGAKALIELFAKVATDDKQVSKVGNEATSKTTRADIYAVQYGENREVYFTAEGGRLFVFSDLGMKLPDQAQARSFADRTKSFFGLNEEIAVFGPKLNGQDHVLTARVDYLSFGYQAFFSSLRALRFDARGGLWTSSVLLENNVVSMAESDWSVQPRGAAFCFGVPVNVETVQTVLGTPAVSTWLKASSAKATACWHPDSKFYTPLITFQGNFAGLVGKATELQPLFEKIIGSREAYWKLSEAEDTPATLAWSDKLPVTVGKNAAATTFSREIGGREGLYPAKESKQAALLTSSRFFRVKLAVTSKALVFSPDDRLVDRALSTLKGKFPSMAASLTSAEKGPSVIFSPPGFAKLAKQSVMDSLPASEESDFRTAASRHLFPNLDAMAKAPMQAAVIDLVKQPTSKHGQTWKTIKWTTNASR